MRLGTIRALHKEDSSLEKGRQFITLYGPHKVEYETWREMGSAYSRQLAPSRGPLETCRLASGGEFGAWARKCRAEPGFVNAR